MSVSSVLARDNFCSEHSLTLITEGQQRTFSQVQAYERPLVQYRPAPSQFSMNLDDATQHFQQMLLARNLPWIPEQFKPQATGSRVHQITDQVSNEAMSQGTRTHIPRPPRILNPEAAEFQVPHFNIQASDGTSQASQSDVSTTNCTMNDASERIKKLEDVLRNSSWRLGNILRIVHRRRKNVHGRAMCEQ